MVSETAVSILSIIIAHASAVGVGLSRKKINRVNIKIFILAEVLRRNKIRRPYWFIFYHILFNRRRLPKSFVLEKLGKSIKAKHFELEAIYSIYFGVKSQVGHYQAITACAQIVRNLKN